ncbi:hypothetical protein [Halomonas sp. M4R1S46]|nr:hypothetical protein [Halomonas sp. M4R1S46]UYG09073.1 hypothetical protein OCT48_07010 [Halomonas sp. M4R1S46]
MSWGDGPWGEGPGGLASGGENRETGCLAESASRTGAGIATHR